MNIFNLSLSVIAAALIYGATALAQVTGGPGVVVAVHENGTATVRIGDQERTVTLPGATVGDKVLCTAVNDTADWECRIHKG
jgi:hypothetical protein